VASEDHIAETIDGKPAVGPRGALVRYREWCTAPRRTRAAARCQTSTSRRRTDIGADIKERETRFVKDEDAKEHFVRESITYGVLDPPLLRQRGRHADRRDDQQGWRDVSPGR
jgi:hypothetical protein